MLVLSRKAGERISIGSEIEISVVRIHKGRVQLGFSAPPEISVCREEVFRRGGARPAGQPVARRIEYEGPAAMSIRITRTSDAGGTVLQVDGQLCSENLAELTKEHRSAEGALILDLSNLQSTDPAGVVVLLELVSLGAEIRGASPYIELLLEGHRETK
jgi:carbon storage regulator